MTTTFFKEGLEQTLINLMKARVLEEIHRPNVYTWTDQTIIWPRKQDSKKQEQSETGEATMMFENAAEGDRVWSLTYGWGTVTKNSVHVPDPYPIVVKFDNDCEERSFTLGGCELKEHKNPTLFWDEIPIDPPPPPKRKVTQRVWVLPFIRGNERQSTFVDLKSVKGIPLTFPYYEDAKSYRDAQAAKLSHVKMAEPVEVVWTEEVER